MGLGPQTGQSEEGLFRCVSMLLTPHHPQGIYFPGQHNREGKQHGSNDKWISSRVAHTLRQWGPCNTRRRRWKRPSHLPQLSPVPSSHCIDRTYNWRRQNLEKSRAGSRDEERFLEGCLVGWEKGCGQGQIGKAKNLYLRSWPVFPKP